MTGRQNGLFLVEGVPGDITTAAIAGWAGHVLAGPRSDLGDVLKCLTHGDRENRGVE